MKKKANEAPPSKKKKKAKEVPPQTPPQDVTHTVEPQLHAALESGATPHTTAAAAAPLQQGQPNPPPPPQAHPSGSQVTSVVPPSPELPSPPLTKLQKRKKRKQEGPARIKKAKLFDVPQIICPLTRRDVQRSSCNQWVQLHKEIARAATICASGHDIAKLFEAAAVAPMRRVVAKRRIVTTPVRKAVPPQPKTRPSATATATPPRPRRSPPPPDKKKIDKMPPMTPRRDAPPLPPPA